jgi:hypothetical protein
MLDPLIFVDLFAETFALLKQHTVGVSHVASLRQSPAVTTSAYWLIGHIVATRAHVLVGLLEAPNTWDLATLARYIPESPIVADSSTYLFADLLRDLERSQAQLNAILGTITPEALQSVVDQRSVGAHLLFYHAHEAYHAGQLDIVCQLARES